MNGRGKHPKRSFETITVDAWVNFMSTTGDHPIMNEDQWAVRATPPPRGFRWSRSMLAPLCPTPLGAPRD